MSMKTTSLCALLILVVLVSGVMLALSGCSRGESQPSVQDPVVESSTESTDAPVVAEVTVDTVSVQPILEESMPAAEPKAVDPVEQPVLTWARDAGGLNHCDRLSIYEDGRVEAIVCKANASEPVVHSTLSDEQIAQVNSWVAAFTPFTRREMGVSSAVRTTVLQGTGSGMPETAVKVQVAAFAANVFFTLTGTE